jgi:hypothetical protein
MERKINFYWFTQQQLMAVRELFTSDIRTQMTEPSNKCLRVLLQVTTSKATIKMALEQGSKDFPYEAGEAMVSEDIYKAICQKLGKTVLTEDMMRGESSGILLGILPQRQAN